MVLPHLPNLIQGCDIQLTTEIYDSKFNPLVVSRVVSALLQRNTTSLEKPYPASIVGIAFSSEAKPASILSGIYQVPIISIAASASELENRGTYPTFVSISPTDESKAFILVEHFLSLNATHFGLIYVRDEFGVGYARHIRLEAEKRGMRVVSVSFPRHGDNTNEQLGVKNAIEELRKSQLKYFFVIPFRNDEEILRQAYRANITGPGYAWFTTDSGLMESEFDMDDREIIDSMNGLGVLVMQPELAATANASLMEFQFDVALQEEFIASLRNVDNQTFVDYNLTKEPPLFSYWYGLSYDALLLPAIAACSIDKEFFTGSELYDAITRTEFAGATGKIRLSHKQTRDPTSVQFALTNVIIDESASLDGKVRFSNRISKLFHFSADSPMEALNPFIYSDNSTIPPPALPSPVVDMHFIGHNSKVSGLALCCLVECVALGWIAFTWWYRKKRVIAGSQPPFLYMLCFGVMVMAASIIPMSLEEPVQTSVLNVSCMSQLWLLSTGFTTTFSALFCKIWRLNKLIQSSKSFKRINVRTQDVLYPFMILLSLNFLLLIVWSATDPLVWTRAPLDGEDVFGRPSDTAGFCASQSRQNSHIFYSFFFMQNLAALFCANWQNYKARNLHNDFHESASISLSMLFLTEGAILGMPVLFLVGSDPSAFFLVRSVLITVVCLGVMMPIFTPKLSLKTSSRTQRRSLSTDGIVRTSLTFGIEALESGFFSNSSSARN